MSDSFVKCMLKHMLNRVLFHTFYFKIEPVKRILGRHHDERDLTSEIGNPFRKETTWRFACVTCTFYKPAIFVPFGTECAGFFCWFPFSLGAVPSILMDEQKSSVMAHFIESRF